MKFKLNDFRDKLPLHQSIFTLGHSLSCRLEESYVAKSVNLARRSFANSCAIQSTSVIISFLQAETKRIGEIIYIEKIYREKRKKRRKILRDENQDSKGKNKVKENYKKKKFKYFPRCISICKITIIIYNY